MHETLECNDYNITLEGTLGEISPFFRAQIIIECRVIFTESRKGGVRIRLAASLGAVTQTKLAPPPQLSASSSTSSSPTLPAPPAELLAERTAETFNSEAFSIHP